ncbi:DUF397 domain-containing protein [Streptomyces mayteni]
MTSPQAVAWQKSSFSGQASNCVNLAIAPDGAGVWLRESDEPAVVLASGQEAMLGLLSAIRQGYLSRTGDGPSE